MKMHVTRQVIYRFAPDTVPALTVESGDRVELHTLDSWSGRLRRPEDIRGIALDPLLANPATGPVAVRGAEPGDSLVAHIERIDLHPPGLCKIVDGGGVLTDAVSSPYLRFAEVEQNEVVLREWIPNRVLRLPIRPMVGVIGVSPPEGSIPTLFPGDHGGNLDINDVAIGAKVYLPVSVPGALFALGDVHATMGDGELSGAGVDVSSTTVVRLEVLKARRLSRPFIETADHWTTCASAPSLQDALRLVAEDMVSFLATQVGLTREDAFLLVSACGDARIGQACGSAVPSTTYLRMPRGIFEGGWAQGDLAR